jgi:hemerythrin-like domain-containing protein
MDAIDLLTRDHKKVRKLLAQLSETGDSADHEREELLAKIEHELEVHTAIEEEIFYPAFKEAGGKEGAKMFYEAVEEHRAVSELVLPDLDNITPTSERFAGRAKVLRELVEHHAEEEEDEMFPRAKKLFSKEQLEELGQRMEQRRKELNAK